MSAVKYGEAHGVQTDTRVFVAYFLHGELTVPMAVLTVDTDTDTVELVVVQEEWRGKGLATALLDFARERTGKPLAHYTRQVSPAGRKWLKARGLKEAKSRYYHKPTITQREADGLGARLMLGLWGATFE